MQKEQIWGSRLEFTLTSDDNPMYRIDRGNNATNDDI